MCQLSKKRVSIDRYVRHLSTSNYNSVKEVEGQFQLLDGLDDQQQQVINFESEDSSAAGHVIFPLTGLEEYQEISPSLHHLSSVSHRNSTGRGIRKRGSALSEEEKRERRRLIDAKYRYNKRVENEKMKDGINMLRNMLQASDQGREANIPGTVQHQFDGDTDFLFVGEEEPHNILQENQPLTYAQADCYKDFVSVEQNDENEYLKENQTITYCQDDIQGPFSVAIQGPFSVAIQDESQLHVPTILQIYDQKSLEENQLLSQPEVFPASYFTFMEKLERDERSSVSRSDFKTLLQGETKEIRGYRIPYVLHPVFEQIVTSYGDITSNCLLSTFSTENVLLQFLASIKEMEDTSFEQVTEELIMKWRDCIAEAKRIKFGVDFAIQHLKKIAKSFIGRKAYNELKCIDMKIEVLEKELNELKTEKLEKLDKYSSLQLAAASEDFPGTVGLF